MIHEIQNAQLNYDLQSGNLDITSPGFNLALRGSPRIQMDLSYGGIDTGLVSATDINGTITVPETVNSLPLTVAHRSRSIQASNIYIHLIGAGGTGGYVIRDLARFIYSLKKKNDPRGFYIYIYDGDTVEERNTLRQNFIPQNIGKNKSEVLAERHSGIFGLEIVSIPTMFTPNSLNYIADRGEGINIIVGCVDNHEARRSIWQAIDNIGNRGIYWIDAGNEKKSGQVVCGYGRWPGSTFNVLPESNFSLPNVTHLYPEILDPSQDHTGDDGLSCAERAVAETQNIFVNMMAASYVLTFIRQIILDEKMVINAIEFGINGVTNPKYITQLYLSSFKGKK